VVGAGPAGLECALQLSRRGYQVMLADGQLDVGGRLLHESQLPGLASYRRVRDYRHQQLSILPEVELLLDNQLSAADIIETEIAHVFMATGARWRHDGLGRQHPQGVIYSDASVPVYTPDDIYNGQQLPEQVLVYDDDHYYLGGVLAESLHANGHKVTLVTPANCVSEWTMHTLEQQKIQARLIKLGVNIVTAQALDSLHHDHVTLNCVYSQKTKNLATEAIVMVTSRVPVDSVLHELQTAYANGSTSIKSVSAVGDCLAPSTVAAAVYAGHLAACELETDESQLMFRREMIKPLT